MKTNQFFDEFSAFEDSLIAQYHEHPLYRNFMEVSREQFERYLLQIGFLSEYFVHWYEVAKSHLQSEAAREVVRTILRDEISPQGPTHQDDRRHDLQLLRVIPWCRKPTRATRKTIRRLFTLVEPRDDFTDLWILVVMRVAGEVLVSEQYRHVIEYAQMVLKTDMSQSRFYVPHYEHDKKRKESDKGHTGEFDELLVELLDSEEALAVAKEAALAAYAARVSINDQFVTHWWQQLLGIGLRGWEYWKLGNLQQKVAGVALCGFLLFITYRVYRVEYGNSPPTWAEFLASLPPASRNVYLDADIRLIESVKRSGDVMLLKFVGTRDSSRRVWGEGP